MEINVTSLFKSINLRPARTVVMRVRNGLRYRLIRQETKNGRVGDYLDISDESYKNDAIKEFLQNYIREGRLSKDTKKCIQAYMLRLKKNDKEILVVQESIDLDENSNEVMQLNQGEDQFMYSSENKYAYRSNSYDIDDIIDFVIKARIQNKSPFILKNEINYPAGTLHTWYKDSNELRIIYSLYNRSIEEINKKFYGYNLEEIIKFNRDIYNDVLMCKNISEDIRKSYLSMIDKFNNVLISKEKKNEKNYDEKSFVNIDVIKVITQTEEMWNAFANSNKEKIFEILYNDEEILSMVLNKIYK